MVSVSRCPSFAISLKVPPVSIVVYSRDVSPFVYLFCLYVFGGRISKQCSGDLRPLSVILSQVVWFNARTGDAVLLWSRNSARNHPLENGVNPRLSPAIALFI